MKLSILIAMLFCCMVPVNMDPARNSCVNDVKKGGVFDEKEAVGKV